MAECLFLPLRIFIKDAKAPVAVAILSMADCQDRRLSLLRHGLPLAWVEHHWPASDLRNLPLERLTNFFDSQNAWRRYRRPWRSSEIGCALSHRSALQAFLATPAKLLLVLEDDAIPATSELMQGLNSLVVHLLQARPQALLCHLGARSDHLDPTDLRHVRLAQSRSSPPVGLHQNRNRPLWRAHAYLISREAAKRCLALEPNGVQLLADDWQARRQAGALGLLLVANPPFFAQDDTAASTQHEPIPIPLTARQSPLDARRLLAAVHHRWLSLCDRLLRRLPYLLR